MPGEYTLGQFVGGDVAIAEDVAKKSPNFPAGMPAENVGQNLSTFVVRILFQQLFRAYAGGGHREELRPNVDEPEQDGLALFEFGTKARHGIEQRACKLARSALNETHVVR